MKYFSLLFVLIILFLFGATRPVEQQGDSVMGQLIRWGCVVMKRVDGTSC